MIKGSDPNFSVPLKMSDESVSGHSYKSTSSTSSLSSYSSFSSTCSATPTPVFPPNSVSWGSETIPKKNNRDNRNRSWKNERCSSSKPTNRESKDDNWVSDLSLKRSNRDSTDSGFNEGYMDVPRALLRRKSSTMHAKCFFVPFFDKLRIDNFSLEFPTLERSEARKKNTNKCVNSKATQQSTTHQQNSETEIESKTVEQLLFLRSRLSPERRQTEPLCNGYFGCDCVDQIKLSTHEEEIETTSPAWV